MDDTKDNVLPFQRPTVVIDEGEEYTSAAADPTLDDLAFIAERYIHQAFADADWGKYKKPAELLVGESDAAIVVKLMGQAVITVEVPL